jgi:hypothetical protein
METAKASMARATARASVLIISNDRFPVTGGWFPGGFNRPGKRKKGPYGAYLDKTGHYQHFSALG